MTGGVTFLLDVDDKATNLVNKEIVEIHQLSTIEQENLLKPLLQEHLELTNSSKASEVLEEWSKWKNHFKVIVPPSEKSKVGL